MKNYFYIFLFTISIIIFPLKAYSQSITEEDEENSIEEVKEEINHILQPLDKSKITSGLLSDYGIHWIDISLFDGTLADSVYTNLSVWLQLYQSVFDSKINNNIVLEPRVENPTQIAPL